MCHSCKSSNTSFIKVSWIVLTVVQVLWTLGLVSLLSFLVHTENVHHDKKDFIVQTTMREPDDDDMTTEESVDFSTTKKTFHDTDGPQSMVRPYYIVCICMSTAFLLLTALPVIGLFGTKIKANSTSLFKSYLDIDIALSILCFVIYILTLSDGRVDKDFAGIMGFYLIIRFGGIYLTSEYMNETEVADIRNLSVNYRTSVVVDSLDSSPEMTETY